VWLLAKGPARRRDGGQLGAGSARGNGRSAAPPCAEGLRRSGQTGNGETPCGRTSPPGPGPTLTPGVGARFARSAQLAPPGARHAPRALETVEKVLTN